MNLSNPEARRGLRSVVMALLVLVLLVLLWRWAERLDPADLLVLAKGLIMLLGFALLGYAFENGMRAVKGSISKDGVSFEAEGDAP